MEVNDCHRPAFPPSLTGIGRVHRYRRGGVLPSRHGEGGFTLVEVVITMLLLSIGLLSLGPLMIGVIRGNRFAQDMTLATALAEDRMEEIVNHNDYDAITTSTFPDEAQGQIRNGDPAYTKFSRTVAIVDSTDALGRSVMKSITVQVSWTGFSRNTLDVILHGRVARF